MRSRRGSCLVSTALAAIAASAGGAGAHPIDTYPEQYEVVAAPGQTPPSDLLVATTYGFIQSHDGGASWRWGCELGFGVSDSWEPEYELTAAGTITATTGRGLFRSTDGGCSWQPATGAAGSDVASTTARGGDGSLWLGSGTAPAVVLRSVDDGVTWTPTGALGAGVDWIESIAVAPSDPSRIYATGSSGAGGLRQLQLWRSVDAGVSWTPLSTASLVTTPISELQVVAIDPTDPDRLFVRITNAAATQEEALVESLDGGAGWTEVLRLADRITGVVVRANRAVVASTRVSGLHASRDGVAAFGLLPGRPYTATCLAELAGGELWMCADNFGTDRMGLGRSADAEIWTAVMTMLDLAGPIDCPGGTVQRDDCERGGWCFYKDAFSIPSDEVSCQLGDVDVMPPAPSCLDCGAGAAPGAPGVVIAGAVLMLLARRRRGRRSEHVIR